MKSNIFKVLLSTFFLAWSSLAVAGSNNGYTTAANVYSGSSSRGWYGGGVAHVLAGWRSDSDAKSEVITEPVAEEPVEDAPAPEKAEEPVSESGSSTPSGTEAETNTK